MSTDNVIDFDKQRRQRQEHQREARLAAVRSARTFQKSDDVIFPAQETDRLLKLVRRRGISQKNIRAALKAAGHTLSHWDRLRIDYTLSPTLARANIAKRDGSEAVVKKVPSYVQLLEALAESLGENPGDVLYRAFENVSLKVDDLPSVQIQTFDVAGEVVSLLKEAAAAVARAEDLKQYFSTLRNTSCQFNPVSTRFTPAITREGRSLSAEPRHRHKGHTVPVSKELAEQVVAAWDALPFPEIALLRAPREVFSGPVLVSKRLIDPTAVSAMPISDAADLMSPALSQCWDHSPWFNSEFNTVDAEIEVSAQLSLVIVPSDESDEVEPMFKSTSFVRLKTQGVERPLTFPYAIRSLVVRDKPDNYCELGQLAAQFNDGWRRVCGFGNAGWKGSVELHDGLFENGIQLVTVTGDEMLDWMQTYERVNLETVSALMTAFKDGDYLVGFDGPRPDPEEIWLSSAPQLQTSIYTGALTIALQNSCQRLKKELNAVGQESHLRRLRERDALNRWHAELSRQRNG